MDNIEEKTPEFASCLLSIYDDLKLFDNGSLDLSFETLSEIMFRKMKAYNIDLNKELGFTHLKPVEFDKKRKEKVNINLKQYSYTCGDGCCTDYGTITTVNGNQLELHNQDTSTIVEQILEHMGYDVDINEEYDFD